LRAFFYLILTAAIFVFFITANNTLAWEAGSTGWCTDADGHNFRCDEGGGGGSGGQDSNSGYGSFTPPAPSAADLQATKTRQEAERLCAECTNYLSNSQFDKAISCFENALSKDPSNFTIQANLDKAKRLKANAIGIEYYKGGNWGMAVKYFQEALTFGRDSKIEYNLRQAQEQLKEKNKLESDLARIQDEHATLASAKERVKGILKRMQDNLDVARQSGGKSSLGTLEFMDLNQPLFFKDAPGSKSVVAPLLAPSAMEELLKEKRSKFENEYWSFEEEISNEKDPVKLKEKKAELEKEYWDLEEQIAKEKDPVKRTELVNRQSSLKIQLGAMELEFLDQYKEQRERKEGKVKSLLELAACAAGHRYEDHSLSFLQTALEEAPGDKGIQRAINYVNYLKEIKDMGVSEFDPKRIVLVDALSYAKDGDWNATFTYLEKAAKDNPDNLAIRDALSVIDGISSHPSDIWAKDLEKEAKKTEEAHRAIAKGLDAVMQNDFESAYELFKQAHTLAPNDKGVLDAMYFADGVVFKSPKGKRGEWQREKGVDMDELYFNALYVETEKSDDVRKLYLKSMKEVDGLNYESALELMKQAHELDPSDMAIRDKMNWLEGICSQRYSVTRQKNK
jgi:tetratricopeptide (TPR) repeat protein